MHAFDCSEDQTKKNYKSCSWLADEVIHRCFECMRFLFDRTGKFLTVTLCMWKEVVLLRNSRKIIGMDVKSVRKQRKKKSLLYRSEYVDFWDVIIQL